MVLNTKQTTVAYRCPHCGAGVMSAVSPFTLRGNMLRLKCTCGKSVMEIEPAGQGKVRMTVPCIICPKPHHYTVSEKILFGEELFVLPCAYSDINIAAMGELNHVKAELARTELELLDMLEENGITDFSALHGDEKDLPDPQILDIILFVIDDLDAEGKIYCNCHPDPAMQTDVSVSSEAESNAEGHSLESRYEAEVTDEGIKLTCRECGASTVIPTDSMLSAHAFLNADSVHLQ